MAMRKLLILLAASAFLASCSSLKISYDYDKNVDFSQFKTYSYYGWAKDSDELMSQFDKKRVETAFAKEFEKRGIEYVEKGGDIVVSLFLVVDEKTSTTAYTNHYGGGPYYGPYGYGVGWGWGMGYSTTSYHQYDYKVGTLVCDIFSSESKQLVWQGVGSGTIAENVHNRERNINRSVNMIMSQYPVKPLR